METLIGTSKLTLITEADQFLQLVDHQLKELYQLCKENTLRVHSLLVRQGDEVSSMRLFQTKGVKRTPEELLKIAHEYQNEQFAIIVHDMRVHLSKIQNEEMKRVVTKATSA